MSRPLRALPVLAIVAVVAYLFGDTLSGRQVFFERDINMAWVPQIEAFVRAVASGAWPVWDPCSGFGRPMIANANTQVLYPLTWINMVLRPWDTYALLVWLHFLLSGAGAYRLSRGLGVSRPAATLAAVAWLASGPFVSLVTLWHHLCAAAWIPWIFLATERALDRPGLRSLLIWGAALAAQVLAGSPDVFILTGLANLAWVLVTRLDPKAPLESGVRLGVRVAFAGGIGLALSAAQWMTTAQAVWRSPRLQAALHQWDVPLPVLVEIPLRFHWNGLPLRPDLVASILEGRAPFLRSLFLGIPLLGLMAAGLATRPGRRLVLLGSIGLVLALGVHSPVHGLVAHVVPPFALVRYPAKAMIFTAFFWSLAAGLGLDALIRTPQRRLALRIAAVLLGLSALSIAAALALRFGALESMTVPGGRDSTWALRDILIGAAFGGVAGAAALAWALGRLDRSATLAILGFACAVDLLAANGVVTRLGPRAIFTHRPEILAPLAAAEARRLYVEDYAMPVGLAEEEEARRVLRYKPARVPEGWPPAAAFVLAVQSYLDPPTAERWGYRGSFDPDLMDLDAPYLRALTERVRRERDPAARSRLLRAGAVTHVLCLGSEPWTQGLTPIATEPGWFSDPIRLFAVPDAMPRTYVVSGSRSAGDGAALDLLASGGIDPASEVILEAGESNAPSTTRGTSRVLQEASDRIVIGAELAAPGFVVLVDAYDPGWQVSVDGVVADLLRANVAFRAVRVAAGAHTVEMRYRPRGLTTGLSISGLALAVALLAARRAGSPR